MVRKSQYVVVLPGSGETPVASLYGRSTGTLITIGWFRYLAYMGPTSRSDFDETKSARSTISTKENTTHKPLIHEPVVADIASAMVLAYCVV
jgi:hypothetical protein